jgi:hypothetical protein
LKYHVLLIKSFSVCSDNKGKIILQNPKTILKQIGAFCKYSQKFSEKKKRKKIGKRIKGSGDWIQPAAEGGPRPVFPLSRNVTFPLSPRSLMGRHHLSSLPESSTNTTTSDAISAKSSAIRIDSFAPRPRHRAHINPLSAALAPPETIAEIRCQAAENKAVTPP